MSPTRQGNTSQPSGIETGGQRSSHVEERIKKKELGDKSPF